MKLSLAALLALALSAGFAFANPTTQPAAAYPLSADVVTGEPLGDQPVIETINGREVRFSNAANAASFKAGGEAMQKQMDGKIVAATKDAYPLKTCLVTDEELGGDMGEPILHVHRPTNQLVTFCCGGCVKKFKKNPETYLPKVAAAK